MISVGGIRSVLGGGTLAVLLAALPAGAEGLAPSAAESPAAPAVAPVAAAREKLADPAVTQATLAGTVCTPGYTRRVRASSRWLRALKRERMAAIGLGPEHAGDYQLDHRAVTPDPHPSIAITALHLSFDVLINVQSTKLFEIFE